MKCTLKAKCSKETFLKYTNGSIECDYDSGYTYGFYDYKCKAYTDQYSLSLLKPKVISQIIRGWNVDNVIFIK